jgi:hypothetical protein
VSENDNSGLSERSKRLIRRSIPHYVQNYYRHPEDPGRNYDFYDANRENYLHYLVDVPQDDRPVEERISEAKSPLFPDNWADINVLRFARGSLKTWSVSSIMGWTVDVFNTAEVGVTAPREDQVDEVIDRFLERVEESDLDKQRTRDNRSHQKFKHDSVHDGEVQTSYSSVKTRTGFGEGDAFRGIHGHMGVMDEAQDVGEKTFTNFKQAIDREIPDVAYFPTIFIIGTPKLTGTFFHRLSNVAETWSWNGDELEWQKESDGKEFLPESERDRKVELEEKLEGLRDADDDYEDEISHIESELDSISGFHVREWHIDQYNCPLHDDASIAFDKEQLSEQEFQNEVLAQFYTPENDFLSREDVWASILENESLRERPLEEDANTLLCVDWGGGKGEGAASTVIVVFQVIEGRYKLLNIDVLPASMEPREETDRIHEWMGQYNVDLGIVDEGHGETQRYQLQEEYDHDNIYGVRYGNIKDKQSIKWNRFENQKRFFTCNKSFMVRSFVQDFKDGAFSIPKGGLDFSSRTDTGSIIVDHLTAPYSDRKETSSGTTKIDIVSDRNDDVFDVFTFAWIGDNYVSKQGTSSAPVSNYRPGY